MLPTDQDRSQFSPTEFQIPNNVEFIEVAERLEIIERTGNSETVIDVESIRMDVSRAYESQASVINPETQRQIVTRLHKISTDLAKTRENYLNAA